jgi:hypothetical protein
VPKWPTGTGSPTPPLTLDDLAVTSRLLLESGAPIDEVNTVRKHLEQTKGGKLAVLAYPATVLTLVRARSVSCATANRRRSGAITESAPASSSRFSRLIRRSCPMWSATTSPSSAAGRRSQTPPRAPTRWTCSAAARCFQVSRKPCFCCFMRHSHLGPFPLAPVPLWPIPTWTAH